MSVTTVGDDLKDEQVKQIWF